MDFPTDPLASPLLLRDPQTSPGYQDYLASSWLASRISLLAALMNRQLTLREQEALAAALADHRRSFAPGPASLPSAEQLSDGLERLGGEGLAELTITLRCLAALPAADSTEPQSHGSGPLRGIHATQRASSSQRLPRPGQPALRIVA